jgi:hypothetical protein
MLKSEHIMIGKDEEQEEVSFKVADRRKFNSDGSVKEGVTLESEPLPTPPAEASTETAVHADENHQADADVDDGGDAEDIPGADDPASFVNFLSTLATNAAASLGAVPHPATGKLSLDLETGKYWLDVLGMLKEKTQGNLHPKEQRLLDGLLGDLRMQYVHLIKATEEKLKAQAAVKFSGEDILGKKS